MEVIFNATSHGSILGRLWRAFKEIFGRICRSITFLHGLGRQQLSNDLQHILTSDPGLKLATQQFTSPSLNGRTQCSKALAKINVALRDPSLATHDEVLLSAMLLSFYENPVIQKRSPIANRDLQSVAARSFSHHDRAMALLRLRRQLKQRTDWSMKIDKLT